MASQAAILGLFSLSLTVSDLECSKSYYSKFGFAVDYETAIPIPCGECKLSRMSLNGVVIELTELPSYPGPSDGHWDHLTLRVSNIEAVVAKLRSQGVYIEDEPTLNKPFLANGIKFVMFRGPDGECLALTEEL